MSIGIGDGPGYVFLGDNLIAGGSSPTPEPTIYSQTFNVGNKGSGNTLTDITVNGTPVGVEITATLNCPSSSSTWADAQIGYCNQADNYGIYKAYQVGRNRDYFGPNGNNRFILYTGTANDIVNQRTSSATGSQSIYIKIDQTGWQVSSGNNTDTGEWTSEQLTILNDVLNTCGYLETYGTSISWSNINVVVYYTE